MLSLTSRSVARVPSERSSESMSDARVLIVSQRAFEPTLSWCTIFEMEDVIGAVDDVDVVELRPRERGSRGLAGRLAGAVERSFGWRIEPLPRPVPVRLGREYEILYFQAENPWDLLKLGAVENWRSRCKIAICLIEEVWLAWLDQRKMLELFRPFDFIFVGCQATAPALERAVGIPTRYVAPATDVARFTPLPHPPQRSIDCLWIGRRAEQTHASLFELSRRRPDSFHYVFDTRAHNSVVYSVSEHREFLGDQIKRARYFITNYAKANAADQTGGQVEVGYRFFEGAAGGAVMIGDPPDCPSFRENFDWPNAVVRLDYNSPDVADLLEQLDFRAEEMAQLRLTNAVQSLRRHDYAHRWAEMLAFVGTEPSPKLQARVDRLDAIADAAERIGASIDGAQNSVPNAGRR